MEEKKPFHKWVVEEIKFADCAKLNWLAKALREITIPAGHDEIIEAWTKQRSRLNLCDCGDEDSGVVNSLLKQKAALEGDEAKHASDKIISASPWVDEDGREVLSGVVEVGGKSYGFMKAERCYSSKEEE